MQSISVQNSQEGLFQLNVKGEGARGAGGTEHIKAVAGSFNEVNLLKPGEARLGLT